MSLKRRAWLTIGAVVLGGAGAVTVAIANPDAPEDHGAKPRKASVHELTLKGTGDSRRSLPRTDTDPFSMVGVVWADPEATVDGKAEVRTRSRETGQWSGWLEVHLEQHLGAERDDDEAKLPGMSEPLWVGPSDAVEARVVRADGTAADGLPKGLELSLVDPGVTAKEAAAPGADAQSASFAVEETVTPTPTDSETATATPSETPSETASETATPTETATETATATPTDTTSPPATPTDTPSPTPTVPTAPPSTVNRPAMTLRAGWGPDKSLATNYSDPEYIDKVQAVFVHHTVGSNDYSCAESAALIRGIYAYHVTPRSGYDGWKDIGYNFLVDKCGQIFEGREGGADLPVLGAHTYGFNSYSTGIAVLGNFETGKPTPAALNSAARVAAWKLGQYGVSPTGSVTLTAAADTGVYKKGAQATLKTISGHRDGFATVCPGPTLYAKLPAIRAYAAGAGRNSVVPTADFNRDGISDLVVGLPKVSGNAGRVTVVPGSQNGPDAASKRIIDQGSPGVPGGNESYDYFGYSNAWGDLNGDGHADLVIGAPGEDISQSDNGTVVAMYGPGLTTGKGHAITSSYRVGGEKLGYAVSAGDFNADGMDDVFAVAPGKPGRWWSWDSRSGKATAGYLNTTAYTGAVGYPTSATGDFNKDGYTDVAVGFRDPGGKGRLLWLKGSATGLQRVGVLAAPGGRSLATGDVNGDGATDLVVGQPYNSESGHTAKGGAVTVVFGSSTGLTSTGRKLYHQDTYGVPGGGESGDNLGWSVSVGDVDLDGYADILAGLPGEDLTRSGASRTNAGAALMVRGTASGPTSSGAVVISQDTPDIPGVTETDDRLGSSVSLADLTGDTRADMALGADGEDSENGTVLQLDNIAGKGILPSSGYYYGTYQLGAPKGVRIGLNVLAP
ncbi:hypothetical protein F0344_13160 [Streptomyces finlayi]|uniref:Peptidoglycan recognition protein family domain-containing protein n=1 Tax=Streptomyces finlayi TaxID=67296 RepID=A0A7G7BJC5_9ACTN|nr:FG-GAP-like repeat-containing protein [Streptomyces finlayi]QNE75440.1 hypothetical protein F0344_13160 [Streptomyces finlayi]